MTHKSIPSPIITFLIEYFFFFFKLLPKSLFKLREVKIRAAEDVSMKDNDEDFTVLMMIMMLRLIWRMM